MSGNIPTPLIREASAKQLAHTVTIINQHDLDFEQYKALHDGHLGALLQATKRGTLPPLGELRKFLKLRARVIELGNSVTMTEPVILTIDYGRSWEAMKTAAGFDASNSNSDITPERFPIVGTGIVQVEASLFNFTKGTSSDNAESVIVKTDPKHPWGTGKIEYTFAYGEAFPDEQLEYPIVGLGSVAQVYGYGRVVCLDGSGLERILRLAWRDAGWRARYRFLAFRICQPSVS